MVKKLLSVKSFDDVIKMLKEKNVFKDIWLLAAQSEMKRQPTRKKFERPVKKVQYQSFWRWSSETVDYRKNH